MDFDAFKDELVDRRNLPELRFDQTANNAGWKVTKRGWPDFFCVRPDGSVCVVEVKPRMKRKYGLKLLTREQLMVMTWLQSLGVECLVSDGTKLYRFNPAIHGDEGRRYSRHRKARK